MVALTSSAPESLDIPEQMQQETGESDAPRSDISDYELCREERIRENRERMQKLGIFDLTQKLTASKPTVRPYRRKNPGLNSPLPPPPSGPVRRSSRLHSSTQVSYCEIVEKKDKLSKEWDILREEGSRPEVYTEEHEKLLGSTEMSWTPFVDGYGKDGKRIYDPVTGKTCHQCRQKTLGHRTHCSNCSMVQGQFCGDCLYMRYGENVLEAKANPNWICPVCRGICNCSLCRQAKGWPPTGSLYRKISSLGYKSVAHYLIHTRRANTDTESNAGSKDPTSAKRALPFSDIEVTGVVDDPVIVSDNEFGDGKLAPESRAEPVLNPADAALTTDEVEYLWKPKSENDSAACVAGSELDKSSIICSTVVGPLNGEVKPEAENDSAACVAGSELVKSSIICSTVVEPLNGEVKPEAENDSAACVAGSELVKSSIICSTVVEPLNGEVKPEAENDSAACVAGIELDKSSIICSTVVEPLNGEVKPESENDSTACVAGSELDKSSTLCVTVVEPITTEQLNEEVTAEALERGDTVIKKENFVLDNNDVVAPKTTPKSTKKRVRCEPTTPDSIGGRLRIRRNNANTSEDLQLACVGQLEKESFFMDSKDVVAPEATPKSTKKRVCCEPTTPDSIGGRLRTRSNKANTIKELQLVCVGQLEKESFVLDNKDIVAPEATPKSAKKRVRCEPMPDSIGFRLRARRSKANTSK